MKKSKKLLTISTSLLLLMGMVACGGNTSSSSSQPTSSETTTSSEAVSSEDQASLKALADAKDYIFQMYKDDSKSTASYKLINKYASADTTFTLTWTLEVKEGGIENAVKLEDTDPSDAYVNVIIEYGALSTARTDYTLKVVIDDGKGHSDSLTFERYVPEFVYTSLSEFIAAEKNTDVNVRGVITMRGKFYSTGCDVWIQNDEGAYYAYRLNIADEATYNNDCAVGNEIIVSGKKDIYNGMFEIKDCTYQVISKDKKEVSYVDATEAFTNAKSEKDTALNVYQNMKIELKGVTISGVTPNDKGNYYNFKIGNSTLYLRASTSYGLSKDDFNTMFAEWVSGFTADVKGVVQVYSNAFYLQPYETDSVTITNKVLSDETQVQTAIDEVKGLIDSNYTAAKTITLPANPTNTYASEVALTYGLDGTYTSTKITDGKLVITVPASLETVGLNVTAKKGDVTKTEKITFTVQPVSLSSINDALKNDDKTIVKVSGTVMAINTRGYILYDGTAAAYIYAYNGDKAYYAVGDYVELTGTKGSYNKGLQIVPDVSSKLDTGTDYTDLTPKPVTAEDMTAYIGGTVCGMEYVQFTGTLSVSGNYYNVNVGSTSVQGSLSYVTNEQKALLTNGSNITVTGWTIGQSSNKYYNVMVSSVTVNS